MPWAKPETTVTPAAASDPREEVGGLAAVGVRPPRADDGDGGTGRQLAADVEDRRRRRELAQAGGVAGVVRGDDAGAQALRRRSLAVGDAPRRSSSAREGLRIWARGTPSSAARRSGGSEAAGVQRSSSWASR